MSAAPDDDTELAAAEYVLGLTSADARRAAQARVRTDVAFSRAVDGWEQRLHGLTDEVAPVEPRAIVWTSIEHRVASPTVVAMTPKIAKDDRRLGFWRGWAVGASALAAASIAGVVVMMAARAAAPAPHQMLATLRTGDGAADIVVAYNTGSRDLILTPIGGMPPPGRMPHLWLKRKDGGMEEMGPIDMAHPRRAHLSQAMGAKTEGALNLMVSLESADAGRLTRPTGPIVARGTFALV
jgi:anti-sigma-K factor RskA